jgi:acyl-CoA thioesterase FadM
MARAEVRVACVSAADFRPIALPQSLFDGIFRWKQGP